MKRFFIPVAIILLIGGLAGYYWYQRVNRPPETITYGSLAEVEADIDRLEPLYNSGRISWQDTYRLGIAYLQKGEYEKARDVLRDAARLRPDFNRTYESLGMVLFRLGDMDGAVKAWKKAKDLNPKALYLDEMMERARRKKALRERIAYLERVVKEDTDWKKRFELATLYLSVRRIKEARSILEALLKVERDNPDIYTALAQAYAMSGDFEKAVEIQKRAVELKPDDEKLKGRLKEMERILEGLKTGKFHQKKSQKKGTPPR